ncbi:MAG: DoxX family membrane protein [Sediminibacterium sp.]|nr:DoxX family membrane protein [Sediminibacterium sp.]
MYYLRKTLPSKMVGINRIMLGIMFIMTGFMKLALTNYGQAWSIQLTEAKFPFYNMLYWGIPILEICIGIIILIGYYARIGALFVIPIMLVAIYVHVTVFNPGAFPAQPQLPIIPITTLLMASVLLVQGSGSWSIDLKLSSRQLK